MIISDEITVLIMDKVRSHFFDNIDDIFYKFNSKYIIVPILFTTLR